MKKILLKNAEIVNEKEVKEADILIKGEKIEGVGAPAFFSEIEAAEDIKAVDLKGKFIFPGIIDAHTHYSLHSRGTITDDDFWKGSNSAAAGGVTTVVDYIDFPEDADFKRAFLERKNQAADSIIDYNFHQVIQDFNEDVSANLADLKDIGLASIKLFTTYRRAGYMINRELWSDVLQRLKELKLLPTVHSEDDALIQDLEEAYSSRGLVEPAYHPYMRPDAAEALAVKDIGEEAMQIGIPLYVVHLSSAFGLEALRDLRQKGADIYAETVPHYLMLEQSYLRGEKSQLYFMTPPLRTSYDNKKLWEGVSRGEMQVIATDHCAFNEEQKMQSNSSLEILPGIPGTETMLPLIYNFGVRKGRLKIQKMVEMLSVNPAKIFGMYPEKGSFAVGSDADLTIFDPELEKKLTAEELHSAAGYSPYKDFSVKGYPIMTIRRGEIIYDGQLKAEKGSGKFIPADSSDLFPH